MTTDRVRIVLSAVVGMLAGYVIWLGAVGLIIVTTPVRFWVAVAAVVLAIFSACAVLLARRSKQTWKAAAWWSAPVLPILASVYVLVLLLT